MRSIPVPHVGLALGLVVCTACTGVRRDEGFVGEPTAAAVAVEAPAPAVTTTHRVGRGETVWSIAVQHGTCVSAILAENGIHDVRAVHRGAVLRVPDASPCGGAAAEHVAQHRVRRGDTISRIALLYGTSSRAVLEANGIRDARRVQAGSTLRVPLGVTARTAVPATAPVAKRVEPPAKEAAAPAPAPAPAAGRPAPAPRPVVVVAKEPVKVEPATARAPAPPKERPVAEPAPVAAVAAPEVAASRAPAVSAAPPGQSSLLREADDALDVGEHHLREAHFEEAIASVEDAFWLLDADDGSDARRQRARGHVLAATAYLALGDQEAARQSLTLALTEEPGLELDRSATPPRLLQLFDEVRGEQRFAGVP